MSNQVFYLGCVESRDDPLMLGRCRVRVVGVHSPDKTEIPIEGLPWAMPLQSITSAAMNGIGFTPVGPVEGSWVMVIFSDPDSKQQPVMLGTIGGIPTKENVYDEADGSIIGTRDGIYVDERGQPINDSSGQAIPSTGEEAPILGEGAEQQGGEEVTPVNGEIGYLTGGQVDALLAACRQRESTNNYQAVNSLGYCGAYQTGMAALEDLGYIKSGSWALYKRNRYTAADSVWAGKDGITTREEYLNNPPVQDKAIRAYWKMLYRRMLNASQVSANTPPEKLGGLLMVAHLKGTGEGGVRSFLRGQASPDGYGTSPNEYYNLGFKTIAPGRNPVAPIRTAQVQNTTIRDTSITPLSDNIAIGGAAARKGDPTKLGFIDPKLRYPLDHMINEADTNRLARAQQLQTSIVTEKETTRESRISFANNDTFTWEQPSTPYNAKYPYNHVYMGESGHIIEYDDTPGNERLHRYHAAGTFEEIDKSGNRTTKVVGTDVTIVERDGLIYIKGAGALNIDGKFSLDIKDTANVFINGDVQLHVKGNMNQIVEGEIHTKCTKWFLQTQRGIHITDDKELWPNDQPDELSDPEIKDSDGIKIFSKQAPIEIKAEEGKVSLQSDRDEINLKADKDFFVDSGGVLNLQGSRDVNIEAGQMMNLKADKVRSSPLSSQKFEGSYFGHLRGPVSPGSGVSAPNPSSAKDATAATTARNATGINRMWDPGLTPIDVSNFIEAQGYENEDNPSRVGFAAHFAPPLDNSRLDGPSSAPTIIARPDNVSIPPTIEFPITKATRLSPNFTLGQLCISDSLVKFGGMVPPNGTRGLSAIDLVLNLQQLCINVLEPMKIAYPNLKINSGLRVGSNTSQHDLGMAVDIGFTTMPPGVSGRYRYFLDAANYVKDNLQYDQLLLEYMPSGSVWLHVSWNPTGNRSGGYKFGTFLNHKSIAAGQLTIPSQLRA